MSKTEQPVEEVVEQPVEAIPEEVVSEKEILKEVKKTKAAAKVEPTPVKEKKPTHINHELIVIATPLENGDYFIKTAAGTTYKINTTEYFALAK